MGRKLIEIHTKMLAGKSITAYIHMFKKGRVNGTQMIVVHRLEGNSSSFALPIIEMSTHVYALAEHKVS